MIVSTDLDRWSNSSSSLVELGERYRVQRNFHLDELKTSTQEVKLR